MEGIEIEGRKVSRRARPYDARATREAIERRKKRSHACKTLNVFATGRARRDARRGTDDRATPPSATAPIRSITRDDVPARSRVSRPRDGLAVPRNRSRRRAVSRVRWRPRVAPLGNDAGGRHANAQARDRRR